MGYDDRREIFDRLEALERMAHSRYGHEEEERRGGRQRGRHGRGRHRDRNRGGGDFEEKRIIDTIVRLVTEQVSRMLESQHSEPRRANGGDEKRLVDLIVRLVSEHVQEIVATELDRRLGPPPSEPPPPGGSPESEED